MRNVTRSGAGTLRPATALVKSKTEKSFRASKQPVHHVSHARHAAPATKPPRPIPPPPAIPAESETFTLELVRPVGTPAVEEKRGQVAMQQQFNPPPPGQPWEHFLTVRLELGDPYELRFNRRLAASQEGDGWQGRARSVLTIRATASVGLVGSHHDIGIHKPVDGRNVHPILLVPVSALHAVFMEVDGRELVNLPAP